MEYSLIREFIALLLIILMAAYFYRKLFYGLKWFVKTVRNNEAEADESNRKSIDGFTLAFILGATLCALIYKWLYM